MDVSPASRADRDLLLQWLLERAPLGVAWCADGAWVEVNAEAARILQLDARRVPLSEWTRRSVLVDAAGRTLVEERERPLLRALRGERVGRSRMQVCRPDGERVDVCVEAFPFSSEDGDAPAGALALVEDISWSLQSEREQAEWLGALGHELNGAMHHFLSSASAAQLYLERDASRARHHLDVAQKHARFLRRLVQDFVDAARVGANALRFSEDLFSLGALLEEMVEAAETADARHRVLLDVEPDLWVRADSDRLKQILTNLFTNAAKYANPGLLTLGARRDGARVVLWLRDEGPGIPPEAQAHIFDRFRRLPSREDGSGLGLWIARQLALGMGGDLWLESAEGQTSTFYVALPTAPEERLTEDQAGTRG